MNVRSSVENGSQACSSTAGQRPDGQFTTTEHDAIADVVGNDKRGRDMTITRDNCVELVLANFTR